jgi:hypothetical protein
VRDLSFEISRWDLDEANAGGLIVALRRSYGKARRRGEAAAETLAPVDLHEFRKATIVFREQLALFRPAWPKLVDAWCAEAQSLRNLLGGLNDLAMLSDFAEGLDAPGAMRLTNLLRAAREDSAQLVEPARRRLYSEGPRRMADRLEAWIKNPKKRPNAVDSEDAAKTRPTAEPPEAAETQVAAKLQVAAKTRP